MMQPSKILSIWSFVVLGLMFFSSCEKIIEINLPPPDKNLVVDARIETGQFARITITRAVPYFDEIDLGNLQTLDSLFVTNAVVVVSNGIISDTCVFTINPNTYPPVYYEGQIIQGQESTKYFLTIYAEGDTITAQTYIPLKVPLDSIYWKPDGNLDSLGYGWGHITEPDSTGNYYRIFAKRQGYVDYLPDAASVIDDGLFNGQSTPFTFVRPAPQPGYLSPGQTEQEKIEEDYFKEGDTIGVKWCSISATSFDYIYSLETAAQSFGNPFSAPTFVRSNVDGALGGFVGYAASTYSYVVPKD